MHRGFIDVDQMQALADRGEGALGDEVQHRLRRVLRLADGDTVELLDGQGRVATARLHGDHVVDAVVEHRQEDHPAVVVAQAAVRLPKLEEVVRRATELGAASILVFAAERSQVGLDRLNAKKLDRLARVAQDAVRQSGRVCTPSVVTATEAEVALSVATVLDEGGIAAMGVLGAPRPLSALVRAAGQVGGLILVGPEGGLSDAEQERWAARGVEPVRLGAHTLRTETASLAALSAFQTSWGRL